MNLEKFVSEMMSMHVTVRLWHWLTESAQDHVTFELFSTQNEAYADGFVEAALGNDIKLSLNKVGVKNAVVESYSIESARQELKKYRSNVAEVKTFLSNSEIPGGDELVTILDDVTVLCSKTLYLLKLN
ncbi:MAG: hypothetical protein H6715_05265 [Myxococcales bacterium]|nr:hypothetical protein [Myxococcales bacterium]MCB9709237.1 hypothetical protein [Myxococcales bacterium]